MHSDYFVVTRFYIYLLWLVVGLNGLAYESWGRGSQCDEFYNSAKASPVVFQNAFETSRILGEYAGGLVVRNVFSQKSFIRDLFQLRPEEFYIDFGTGDGGALESIYGSGRDLDVEFKMRAQIMFSSLNLREQQGWTRLEHAEDALKDRLRGASDRDLEMMYRLAERPFQLKPNSVGITYKVRRVIPETDKMKLMKDRLFEDIPDEEIPRYKLASSFFGVFSYTKKVSDVLFKALSRAEPGARLYIYGMNFMVKDSLEKPSVPLETWLKKHATGIKIHTPTLPNRGVIMIERTSEALSMPVLKFLKQVGEHETPPKYIFLRTSDIHN
ncbi:MAG: hypothetical protein JNL11_01960 [Bdellovibrionaceae bacterium]|nr:hypothetical protein [Pseudobdellovibrionaceae bacterium]